MRSLMNHAPSIITNVTIVSRSFVFSNRSCSTNAPTIILVGLDHQIIIDKPAMCSDNAIQFLLQRNKTIPTMNNTNPADH